MTAERANQQSMSKPRNELRLIESAMHELWKGPIRIAPLEPEE
jgi:hypothetical protein